MTQQERASHLMRLLYGSRTAWPLSAVVISRLASMITKWNAECDRRIERLMAYIAEHGDLVISGCLSSADADVAELHVWPDADLAGDELSTRSTSGYLMDVAGTEGRTSPISWGSRKQAATSSSTPQAEAQSAAEVMGCNQAVQGEALPAQHLMELILGRPVTVRIHEDNQSTIAIVRKG